MIWENAYTLNYLLNELITEKFGPTNNCNKDIKCGHKYKPSTSSVTCTKENVGVSCG